MSNFSVNLMYTPFHQWIKIEDGFLRVGITDFAQSQLGDVVFVKLPTIGKATFINESCATIESVKTASDILSPVSGKIVDVNQSLIDSPEKINESPYESWLFCIESSDPCEIEQLLSAESYAALINLV